MRRKLLIGSVLALVVSCTQQGGGSTTTTSPEPTSSSVSPTTTTGETERSTADILDELGGEPCPDSEFTCVKITVPLDHFDPSNTETTEVTFAVLPASGESRGAFVTATGGPGSSGIAVADSYTSLYYPELTENFDMVFYDQRGIASSGGFTCPAAAAEYFRAEGDIASAAGINLLVDAARTFADDCIAEMGDPAELAYTSTAQVVEDIEAFRQTFDYDQFVIFGESYGTQVGQAYAAAHPENLDRLVIDGVVDLTVEGLDYAMQLAEASSNNLDLVLAACEEDEACASDMGGPAGEVFDRLHSLLLEGPMEVEFPLPAGGTEARTLSIGDFETLTSGQLYTSDDRMMLQRALAAYGGRGDLVPLLRLAYIDLVIDPTTMEPIDDPSWSDAMYYGVQCLDYAYPGNTPEEKADAYVAAGVGLDEIRLGSFYFGDLPCAFWPHTITEGRPPALTADGVQVLVLGSTVDPVTPYHQGLDVYSRLADGYKMSKEGGPHVIFGWGEACPDDEVTAFIVDGTPPTTEICDGVVADEYQPLFPVDFAELGPEGLIEAAGLEIYYLPEYYYWDLETDTSVGCSNGGTMSFTATDTGNDFTFADCELAPGVTLDGAGSYDADNDVFDLPITVDGA